MNSTVRSKSLIWLLLFLLFIGNCTISDKNDNPVILEISGIIIQKNQFVDGLKELRWLDQETSIDALVEKYKERLYILAEAYRNGYDKDTRVADDLKVKVVDILTKNEGFLYNEIVTKNVVINQADIDDLYDKTGKVLQVNVYHFDEKKISKEFMNDQNKEKYQQNIAMKGVMIAWPYDVFYKYRDDIYKMGEDQYSDVFFHDNSYKCIYVLNVSQRDINRNNYPLENVKRTLRDAQEKYLVEKYHSEAFESADLTMYYDNINTYLDELVDIEASGIIPDTVGENLLLMTYVFGGRNHKVYGPDFARYYNKLLFRWVVKERSHLDMYLKEMVFEKFALRDCEKLGFYDHPEFVAKKKNRLHKKMCEFYIKDLYDSQISVTHEEEYSYYKTEKYKESFEEVSDYIEHTLHAEKLEQKKKELVAELKKKYTIVDNIDYDYYTSEKFLQSITADESQ